MSIDYKRIERGLSGVGSNHQYDGDPPKIDLETENARLKKIVDLQRNELKRIRRLLGIRLELK